MTQTPALPAMARRTANGFTLIELMAVVAIIALMIGIAVPAVMFARRAAAVAVTNSQMAAIQTGLSAFFHDFGEYPPSSTRQIIDNPKLKEVTLTGRGAQIVGTLLTGFGSDRGVRRQEAGFKIRGKTYGPYVKIDRDDQLSNSYEFIAPWKTPIHYWRANRGTRPIGNNLHIWGSGNTFRFDYTHCKENPAYDRLYDSHGVNDPKLISASEPSIQEKQQDHARQLSAQLQASEFVLFNSGPDTQTGAEATRKDDLMLSGR